jgi:flavodoxin I
LVILPDFKEVEVPKALIIYETRKGNTQLMAEIIQESMIESGVDVTAKRISEVDLAELADCAGIILGSPTYNKDMIGTMKTFLFRLEKVNLKGKVGASFGAYGWSGEAVGMLRETMVHIYGMDVLEPAVKLAGNAGGADKAQYQDLGKKIAQKIKERVK